MPLIREALKRIFFFIVGFVVGVLSALVWIAPGFLLNSYLGILGIIKEFNGNLLLLILVLAAVLGGLSFTLRDHPATPLIRLLGRVLNIYAFLVVSGLPVLKLGVRGVYLEIDFSPLILLLVFIYVVPQTLIDFAEYFKKT